MTSHFFNPAKGVTYVLGSEAPRGAQRQALAAYVHRFTGDHRPRWTDYPWKDGKPYPLQFADDSDWLSHTHIPVTKSGRLGKGDCHSMPTWPNDPDLRQTNLAP